MAAAGTPAEAGRKAGCKVLAYMSTAGTNHAASRYLTMTADRIVAVAFLTQRDLQVLGKGFTRHFSVPDDECSPT